MPEQLRNVGASVRQRLFNLARANGQPLELLLTRYALERLLHRLSLSAHGGRFVLKGALLLTTWFDEPHRATRDLDLLGFGDPSDEALVAVFREIMSINVDDGVNFDTAKLHLQPIREELEYGGSRLRTTAALAGARIPADTGAYRSLRWRPASDGGLRGHIAEVAQPVKPVQVVSVDRRQVGPAGRTRRH